MNSLNHYFISNKSRFDEKLTVQSLLTPLQPAAKRPSPELLPVSENTETGDPST